MLKIGLTGNIGSGKSTVSRIFETLGVPVYRSDDEAKKILDKAEVTEKVKQLFGSEILDENGKINRGKLAAIVFSDKIKISNLNNIIHPLVMDDFKEWTVAHLEYSYIIMESAILFETNFSSLFDKIIFVSAPETVRINRIMLRDRVDAAHVKIRMKQQLSEKDKIKKADFVIVNDDKSLIITQVLKIHAELNH
jgi:dephospho-CoA kinase